MLDIKVKAAKFTDSEDKHDALFGVREGHTETKGLKKLKFRERKMKCDNSNSFNNLNRSCSAKNEEEEDVDLIQCL